MSVIRYNPFFAGYEPFPGLKAEVVNDRGETVGPGGGGYLVLKSPWPAMLRGIYKAPERYMNTYWSRFPGCISPGTAPGLTTMGTSGSWAAWTTS